MELVGAICEGEWSSLNGMCSGEADFMAQFLGNCSSLPNEVLSSSNFLISSSFWPAHEANVNIAVADDSAMYSDETTNSVYCFAQENSCSGGSSSIFFPSSSHENYYPSVSNQISVTDNNLMTVDHDMMDRENNSFQVHLLSNNVMEKEDHFLNHDVSNDSMESNGNLQEKPMPKPSNEDKLGSPLELSKKRPRIPVEVQKNKRNIKMKKILKLDNDDEHNNNNNAMLHRQSSSSCCSEDDSNGSHELNGGFTSSTSSKGSGAIHLSAKTRASRGSATDPQSLYARKRRERINERLRILQSLVPNGTKVDISTMLEEAVEYVKFLQLQIKLLSSDELWMYAPIAYNGMDIGLDLRITTPKSQS